MQDLNSAESGDTTSKSQEFIKLLNSGIDTNSLINTSVVFMPTNDILGL